MLAYMNDMEEASMAINMLQQTRHGPSSIRAAWCGLLQRRTYCVTSSGDLYAYCQTRLQDFLAGNMAEKLFPLVEGLPEVDA